MIPCKDCLLMPVCRGKDYRKMVFECSIIRIYLYTTKDSTLDTDSRSNYFNKSIYELKDLMNPRYWNIVWLKDSANKISVVPTPECEEYRRTLSGKLY